MITIQINGLSELKADLQHALNKLKDVEKPLTLAGFHMMKSIDDNFRQEGRPDKWEDLSPMTKKMRRGNPPYAILQDTGTLRSSISMAMKGDTVRVGTSAPYAQKLQFGGINIMPAHDVFPKNRKALKFVINGRTVFASHAHIPTIRTEVPPRPVIVVQDEDLDVIGKIFEDWIADILG